MTPWIELKTKLAESEFRSRFHLTRKDRAYLAEKGWAVLEEQAGKIIRKRLAPRDPENDGRQTPMRGHPVFTAQHATGCCCRNCLAKWHAIPSGRPLTDAETDYVVSTLLSWLRENAGDLSEFPVTPDLFPIDARTPPVPGTPSESPVVRSESPPYSRACRK